MLKDGTRMGCVHDLMATVKRFDKDLFQEIWDGLPYHVKFQFVT
jgi:hypothetical protein